MAFWALGGLVFGFPSSTNVLRWEKYFLKVTLLQRQYFAWLRGPSTRGRELGIEPARTAWDRRRRPRRTGRGSGRGLTAAARWRSQDRPSAHGGEGFRGRGTLDGRSEDMTSLVSTTTAPCARCLCSLVPRPKGLSPVARAALSRCRWPHRNRMSASAAIHDRPRFPPNPRTIGPHKVLLHLSPFLHRRCHRVVAEIWGRTTPSNRAEVPGLS